MCSNEVVIKFDKHSSEILTTTIEVLEAFNDNCKETLKILKQLKAKLGA
jgi:hypothetical protein